MTKFTISSSVATATHPDNDTVELFNRDSLSINTEWLSFHRHRQLQDKLFRLRIKRYLLITMFTFLALSLVSLYFGLFLLKSQATEALLVSQYSLDQCQAVAPQDRVDCNPDPPISQEVCQSRGCCWSPTTNTSLSNNTTALPPVNVPFCYFSADYVGYKIDEQTVFELKNQTIVKLVRVKPSGFDDDVNVVKLVIDELTSNVLRIKFVDYNRNRYEVPLPALNLPKPDSNRPKQYTVSVSKDDRTLSVLRSNDTIFHVNLAQLIYSDQFLQLTTSLPSEHIYGIGEHRDSFRKNTDWKRYTLFNRDQYPLPDQALYGSHPFYLTNETVSGFSSGVFLFNSNAMDIITQPAPAITFRTIGGILDFFIFLGPTPEDVVKQYHNLIGLPKMPPMWALGYHLSRFGYRNMSNLRKIFDRTRAAKIPFDVQWTDIDMMNKNNDFTYDTENFNELPQFITDVLHKSGMRFIPMFDCGISAGEDPSSSYSPYQMGLEMDVFVKNSSNQLFVGKVWNRKSTVWPDFTHPNATKYWTSQFAQYHKIIPFDGAWIDMNEPSNFLNGQTNGCPVHKLETPAYTPGMTDDTMTLSKRTLCMTARHTLGTHYNLHNLYGFTDAIVTNRALKTVLNRRPFIISRSTAPGHGHYASHWTGDIISDWQSMKWSIASILNFNIFGVPMVGADICGFLGNTTEELCARWHQLGAFYTFVRNHNTIDTFDQDPVALGPRVVKAAIYSLQARYTHLPYLYSLFYKVHVQGGTVLKPLFFEFPDDPVAPSVETQFLWGPALMVAPALEPGQKNVSVYFPQGNWYHINEYRKISSTGEFITEDALFDLPNLYYRTGFIVPTQDANVTIELTKASNFKLVILLDNSTSDAVGELYWDSGDGLDTEQLGAFNQYQFTAHNRKLVIKSQHLGYETSQIIQAIDVIGLEASPTSVLVNGKDAEFFYDTQFSVMEIVELKLPLYLTNPITHVIEWKFSN